MSDLTSTLERFALADVSLLEKRSLLRRVDSKFLLPVDEVAPVLERVVDDYGIVLAGDNRLATYRTVYYDTPELLCFHDHRRGCRPRQKVRIRHYDDRGVSFLEIKTKRSEYISSKTRTKQTFDDSHLSDVGRAFVAEHSRLPSEALEPAVHTNFQRVTLVGFNTDERLTLDLNLSVSLEAEEIDLGSYATLEVKQPRFSARTPIMRALRAYGYRPASASKYCTATALLKPGLRLNRLLPVLRKIERLRT